MKLKCIIIDDEQAAINLLKEFIKEIPFVELVFSSTDALSTVSFFQHHPIDILFLDINMPKISGIEFMELLQSSCKPDFIILTTAYTEFALLGYEYKVFDYLVKPIPFERFLKSMLKIADIQSQHKHQKEDYFFVKVDTKNNSIKVSYGDILYIEGMKNYVNIVTEKETITTLLNLKDLEERLTPHKFMRIHRSFIIPLNKIVRVDGNRLFLLNSKGYLPIGGSYKDNLTTFLEDNFIA